MSEENVQPTPTKSFSQVIRENRTTVGSPVDKTVVAAPVVPPVSTPEVQPQAASAADVTPTSFTGNETEEELRAFSQNPNTVNRIQKLAQERNEAKQAKLLMERQIQQLQQTQEAQRQQLELVQGQQQPSVDQWAFKEPFPDDGSPEEQEQHRFRKEAYEKDTLPMLKAQAHLFAKALAPVQQEAAMRAIEKEWQAMGPDLAQYGTSRAELEESVLRILTSPGGAHRNVRSVAYDVMAQMGVLNRFVPEAGNFQVPGSGNAPPVAPAAKQPLHSDPRQAALLQAQADLRNNPNPAQARRSFSEVIKSQRR